MQQEPDLVIQQIRDVTVVDFNQTLLLDTFQVEQIGKQLQDLVVNQARKKIILDFSKVRSMSTSTLSILLSLQKKAEELRGEVVLCALRKELRQVFKISKLEKLFTFCPSEEKALARWGITI